MLYSLSGTVRGQTVIVPSGLRWASVSSDLAWIGLVSGQRTGTGTQVLGSDSEVREAGQAKNQSNNSVVRSDHLVSDSAEEQSGSELQLPGLTVPFIVPNHARKRKL